jgi:hypothetical protein
MGGVFAQSPKSSLLRESLLQAVNMPAKQTNTNTLFIAIPVG